MLIWVFILVRVVSNPLSNVFQKVLTIRRADPLFVICVPLGLLSLGCLPLVGVGHAALRDGFWLNIWVCTLLAVVGNVLLVKAVRLCDLSILGPINAYKSLVSLVPGILLLHEIPKALGLAGIVLIVAGSYFIVDERPGEAGGNRFGRLVADRGVQYRLAALILSALEAVFLKRALLASSPLVTFAFWSVLGFAVSLAAVAALTAGDGVRREVEIARVHWKAYLSLSLTTGLMQLCTLLTFGGFQVGYALALFQTSTLLTVVLGHRLFQEQHFIQRLVGSTVMVAGAALIVTSR